MNTSKMSFLNCLQVCGCLVQCEGGAEIIPTDSFVCLSQLFFEDNIDDAKYCGRLYGLGSGSSQPQNGLAGSTGDEANNKH